MNIEQIQSGGSNYDSEILNLELNKLARFFYSVELSSPLGKD